MKDISGLQLSYFKHMGINAFKEDIFCLVVSKSNQSVGSTKHVQDILETSQRYLTGLILSRFLNTLF